MPTPAPSLTTTPPKDGPPTGAWCRSSRSATEKSGQRSFQHVGGRQITDEDQSRIARAVGPGGKMLGRMQQVLHSMHDGRLIDTFQIEYCLETQGVAAIAVQVHAEPDAEGRPVQGRFPLETDGADASVRRA